MRAASMFSGIGGAELGLPEAEWVWCAEIEPFPCAVLDQRFGHPNLGDVLADDFIDRARALGPLDLICGGPPCQAFSFAGSRLSMADPRGNLSLRFVQVLHAIRPRNAAVENVLGWLSTSDNAFGCFLGAVIGGDGPLVPCAMPPRGKSNAGWRWRAAGKAWQLREPDDAGLPVYVDNPDEWEPGQIELVELDARHIPVWPSAGMASGPRARLAWRVLDAQYAGLAQRRERVFVVVDFGDGADPATVLFERKGLQGNHPPSREAGQGVTGTLSARAQGGGGLGTDFEIDGALTPVSAALRARDPSRGVDSDVSDTLIYEQSAFIAEITGTLPAGGNETGGDRQPGTTADTAGSMLIAHTLRAEGFDASEDGTGRGIPLVPVAFSIMPQNSGRDYKARAVEVAQPLMAGGPVGGNQGGDYICQPVAAPAVAVSISENSNGFAWESDVSPTVQARTQRGSANSFDGVIDDWQVRRLTVTECERLQGYPDNHTLIEFGSRRTVEPDMAEYLRAKGVIVEADNATGKLRTNAAADGPRYKGLGNAWAVKCVRPILANIHQLQQSRRPA